jgi:N-acetylglucosaminyldiphosphoundecaprenol N-acetyl-beta-D-mannosaminyltransferase
MEAITQKSICELPMSKQVKLLGVHVNLLDMEALTDMVMQSVHSKETTVIPNHNLHSVYLYHKHDKFQKFYSLADVIHVDGMSLVMVGKLFGKNINGDHRITYLDWLDVLFRKLEKENKKIFYLGSKPGIAKKAADILKKRFPKLDIEVSDGYFQLEGEENVKKLSLIDNYAPDVLMVGMGMPRQEYWILDNYEQLNAKVVLTTGAFFDYIAGEAKTPPRILGTLGLEWLYRLINEPKRLWKRYLLEPVELLFLMYKNRNI